MSHKRTLIRKKIETLLKGATICGDNVFTDRESALFQTELPAIIIYPGDENSEFLNPPENLLKRTIPIYIEFALIQTTGGNIDDQIDDLCLQIEGIIKPKNELDSLYSQLVQSVVLTKTERGIFEKAKQIIGSGKLTYDFEYDSNY